MGQRQVYNSHALQHMAKVVELPIASIGVGDGETLAPIEMVIEYPSVLKQVVEPPLMSASYEYSQIDGFSDALTEKNFTATGDFGNPLEGFGY